MQRVFNWPERLAAYLEEARERPFRWGDHDCALYVCGAVKAMTGVDMAESFRGRYSGLASSQRAMREFAGGGLEPLAEKMAATHGMPETAVKLAQRGDVVMFDTELGATLGIVGLTGFEALSVGPLGAIAFPLASCRRAWRVP